MISLKKKERKTARKKERVRRREKRTSKEKKKTNEQNKINENVVAPRPIDVGCNGKFPNGKNVITI